MHVQMWSGTYVQRHTYTFIGKYACMHACCSTGHTDMCSMGTVNTCAWAYAPMLEHTPAYINMYLVAWQTWFMNPQRWHMHIHVCTLTRLCACIKRTNPVSQLTYTFMCIVWHLLKGGAEGQNMLPCVYAHTEVGDLMKVCNFKRHTGGTSLLFAQCHSMKQMYICVAMWFTQTCTTVRPGTIKETSS